MQRTALLTAFLFAGGLAFAQTGFEAQDENDDGKLSRDEYYGVASDAGVYSDYDLDGDGFIERNEFDEVGWDYDYDAWDVDNDTYLDTGEFYGGYFDEYDDDENGHWDDGEWDDAGDGGLFDV